MPGSACSTIGPTAACREPMLLVKIGVALANAGRWSELAEVERQLKERYAGETVTVAGQRSWPPITSPSLSPGTRRWQLGAAGGTPRDLAFADDAEPAWQFRFEAKDRSSGSAFRCSAGTAGG